MFSFAYGSVTFYCYSAYYIKVESNAINQLTFLCKIIQHALKKRRILLFIYISLNKIPPTTHMTCKFTPMISTEHRPNTKRRYF